MVDVKAYAAREPEWITKGDTRLAATVDRRDQTKWLFGVHGGHSESKRKGARWAHLCKLAERLDWSFATFDLRDEDGDSQPHLDATITQSASDLSLMIQTLVPENGQVVLWGHSRGAFVSFAWAATRRRVRQVAACILIAPAWSSYARFLTRIEDLGLDEEKWRAVGEVTYKRFGKNETKTWHDMDDAREWDRREPLLFANFRTPTLVIHSLLDDVIPVGYSRNFGIRCFNADMRLVHIGDHRFDGYEPWLMAETEEFLLKHRLI